MIQETISGLVNNIALLLLIVFLYILVTSRRKTRPQYMEQAAAGIILGALCVVLMMNPWEFSSGVFFDTRSILICLSGLFFGMIPTVILMAIGAMFRIYQGGTAVWMGLVTIGVSGVVGLAWRYYRKKSPNEYSLGELLLFGLVVHTLPTLNLIFLPRDVAIRILSEIGLIVTVVYSLITMFLGKLLALQYEHKTVFDTLRRNEALLNKTQQVAKIGGWEYCREEQKAYWTDEVYRIFGVSRGSDTLCDVEKTFSFYHPEDRPVIENAFKRVLAEGDGYDLVLRLNSAKGEVLWVRTTADVEKERGETVRVYGHIMDITQRVAAQKALKESEERFRRALENIPGVVIIYDADLRIQYINSATKMITGLSPEHFIGKHESEIWPPDVYNPYMPTLQEALRTGRTKTLETALEIPGAGRRYLKITCVPLIDDRGDVRELLGITHDFTKEKEAEEKHRKLEEQFRQAQKMEAVGRLAGGVAHDFNNLLSIVLGYSEMLLEDMGAEHPDHDKLKEILDAAVRAKDITRQLLAFGRKQVLEVKIFDVNEVVSGLQKLLKRLIGEDIELKIGLMDRPGLVKADVSQLEQVIMNLVVNAKDAMPNGGDLVITTESVDLGTEDSFFKAEVLKPGRYIRIGVSDTGSGISPADLENIFEPFFTTKEKDKGTGLGLATVYGIIKQHGGNINVYSEPGHGSTFNVYLPGPDLKPMEAALPSTGRVSGPSAVSATILIVEDDAMVRKMGLQILKRNGYEVIESESAEDAVAKARSFSGVIHLLLTDVIMPTMNGPEVYRQVSESKPGIKVLYMSGYPGDVITRHGVLNEGLRFIQKPFTKRGLLEKVAEVLSE